MKAPEFQKIYHDISRTANAGAEAEDAAGEVLGYLEGKKIMIYPAGALGRLLERTLRHYGIRIEAFIDRAAAEIIAVGDVPVREPSSLTSITRDFIVLIAVNNQTLYDTLDGIVREQDPGSAIIDGFLINRLLRYPLCQNQLNNKIPFNLVQCENCGYEGKGCTIFHTYLRRVAPGTRQNDAWRSTKFDWFGCIVSQRCSMKCKYCCESIPYIPNPGFVPAATILSDIRKVAQSCYFLKFVEFIGGEPFLHPEIEKILTGALEIDNIGYIKSFTNGTILPSDSLCDLLGNSRIMLHVSNYEKCLKGRMLERFLSTKKKLDDCGIHYVYIPQNEWKNFSSYDLFTTSVHSIEERFSACPIAQCHRLYYGTLYRCPHQYAGIMMGKLEKRPFECIDVHTMGQKELADAIEKFEELPFTDACRHCPMPFDARVILPGEQILK